MLLTPTTPWRPCAAVFLALLSLFHIDCVAVVRSQILLLIWYQLCLAMTRARRPTQPTTDHGGAHQDDAADVAVHGLLQ